MRFLGTEMYRSERCLVKKSPTTTVHTRDASILFLPRRSTFRIREHRFYLFPSDKSAMCCSGFVVRIDIPIILLSRPVPERVDLHEVGELTPTGILRREMDRL